MKGIHHKALILAILAVVAALSFAAGIAWSMTAHAAEAAQDRKDKNVRIVYPKKTELEFTGMALEGEVRNPGEFYFQRRPEEKFDSLVKRRKNFHKEMLRDVVFSK